MILSGDGSNTTLTFAGRNVVADPGPSMLDSMASTMPRQASAHLSVETMESTDTPEEVPSLPTKIYSEAASLVVGEKVRVADLVTGEVVLRLAMLFVSGLFRGTEAEGEPGGELPSPWLLSGDVRG